MSSVCNATPGFRSTGIPHLVNKTPLEWYSTKQATVETATYGSKFVAVQTCVEQIIDLRTTLHYLCFSIRDKSYIFDDINSVVDSSMQFNWTFIQLNLTVIHNLTHIKFCMLNCVFMDYPSLFTVYHFVHCTNHTLYIFWLS